MHVVSLEAWKSFLEWGGIALLAFTVFLGAGALLVNSRLGAMQEDKLRQFDKDLTGAKTELGKQQERTANAEARVAGLEKDAADAKAEMARQQARAATAEQSLLELQQKVKLRHLSTEERKRLTDFLHAHANEPKGPIRVDRLFLDESSQPFAEEVRAALDDAGWHSNEIEREMIPNGGKVPVGVVLVVRDAKSLPPHLDVLDNAFRAAGLHPSLGENPNTPEGVVVVCIGVKP